MSRKLKFSLGVAFLATSTFAMSDVSPVHAYPASGANFPSCGADAAAEYCIQQFAFTPTGGVLREVTPSNLHWAILIQQETRKSMLSPN